MPCSMEQACIAPLKYQASQQPQQTLCTRPCYSSYQAVGGRKCYHLDARNSKIIICQIKPFPWSWVNILSETDLRSQTAPSIYGSSVLPCAPLLLWVQSARQKATRFLLLSFPKPSVGQKSWNRVPAASEMFQPSAPAFFFLSLHIFQCSYLFICLWEADGIIITIVSIRFHLLNSYYVLTTVSATWPRLFPVPFTKPSKAEALPHFLDGKTAAWGKSLRGFPKLTWIKSRVFWTLNLFLLKEIYATMINRKIRK